MKIGLQELLIVFIVALVVLGPDKLPYYAKKLGEALRQFKQYSSEATKDIRESVVEPLQEAQRPLKEAMEPVTELKNSVDTQVRDLQKSFRDIGSSAKKTEDAADNSHPDGSVTDDHTASVQTDAAPAEEPIADQADAVRTEEPVAPHTDAVTAGNAGTAAEDGDTV